MNYTVQLGGGEKTLTVAVEVPLSWKSHPLFRQQPNNRLRWRILSSRRTIKVINDGLKFGLLTMLSHKLAFFLFFFLQLIVIITVYNWPLDLHEPFLERNPVHCEIVNTFTHHGR